MTPNYIGRRDIGRPKESDTGLFPAITQPLQLSPTIYQSPSTMYQVPPITTYQSPSTTYQVPPVYPPTVATYAPPRPTNQPSGSRPSSPTLANNLGWLGDRANSGFLQSGLTPAGFTANEFDPMRSLLTGQSNARPALPPAQPGLGTTGSDATTGLGDLFGNIGFLEDWATRPNPVSALPGWQAMVEAANRGIGRGQDALTELFGVNGGRYSTAFGQASVDYQTQAQKDLNAQLLQAQTSAMENALGRQYGAANTLGQMGFGAASLLSQQDFQREQVDQQQALQAAMQLGMSADQAAQLMAQYGAQGALAMLTGSNAAANSLFGNASNLSNTMYGTQMGLLPSIWQQQLLLGNQGINAANVFGNLWQGNIGLGNQVGAGQYGILSNQVQQMYNEWLRTQPEYNPLLSYLFSAATGYPPTTQPQYQTPWWQTMMGMTPGLIQAMALWPR